MSAVEHRCQAEPTPTGIVAYGGYTDVILTKMKCCQRALGGDKKVYAAKVIRCDPRDNASIEAIFAALRGMVLTGVPLDPERVVPSLDVMTTDSGLPGLVQPYFKNGNIADFLRAHPDADKLSMIEQSVAALKYLHEQDVEHGNITPNAFLVTDEGQVLGSDPGLRHAIRLILHDGYSVSSEWHFKPREDLEPSVRNDLFPSKPKDVYSMACVIFEMYGGRVPNHRYPYRGIMFIIGEGHIAMERPPQIGTTLWGTLQRCWDRVVATRFTVDELETALQQLTSVD